MCGGGEIRRPAHSLTGLDGEELAEGGRTSLTEGSLDRTRIFCQSREEEERMEGGRGGRKKEGGRMEEEEELD